MLKQLSRKVWGVIVVVLIMLVAAGSRAGQETCQIAIQLDVAAVGTNYPQKGFLPFIISTNEPKIYLNKKIEYTADSSNTATGHSLPETGTNEYQNGVYHVTYKDELEYPSGSNVVTNKSFSGSISNRADAYYQYYPTPITNSYVSTRTGVSTWSNGGAFSPGATPTLTPSSESLMETNMSSSITVSRDTNGVFSYSSGAFSETDNPYWYGDAAAGQFFGEHIASNYGTATEANSVQWKVELSSPVSVSNFVTTAYSNVQGAAYPTNNFTGTPKASFFGVPLVAEGDAGTFTPEVSKFKFRIRYRGPKGEKSVIQWQFVTNTLASATSTNGTTTGNVISQEVTFNGDCQEISWQEVLPPSTYGSIEMRLLTSQTGCKPCEKAGAGDAYQGSVGFETSLGHVQDGKPAGTIFIHEESAGAGLATPAVLQEILSPYVKVIKQSGAIRQASGPDCLVDVVTVSTNKFELRFYSPGATLGTNGLYGVSGSPFRTWVFEGASGGGLQIKDGTGGGARQWTFAAISGGWSLTEPGGDIVKERVNQTVSGNRVEKNRIKNADGDLIFYSEREWKTVAGIDDELLVRETVGDGGDAQSTYYSYYESAGAGFGKLKLTLQADGGWEKLEYNTNNLVTKRVTPFKSAATNASESACRVITYSYAALTNWDSGLIYLEEPRVMTETVLGTVVAKTYHVYTGGEIQTIRAYDPAAAWTNSLNEKTVSRTRTSLSGLMDETVSPLGGTTTSREIVDEATGYRTNIVVTMRVRETSSAGYVMAIPFSSGSSTNVTGGMNLSLGTKSVSVTSSNGWPVMRSTYEIFKTEEVLVDRVTYSNVDASYGPQTVTYLDGSTETTTYDCCGVASRTDRNGVETVYTYDSNHRLVATTRLGITMASTLDAAGNVVATTRTGTDATEIVTSRAGYDTAGRVKFSVDALSHTNTFTELLGGEVIRTTTAPDFTTVVETHYGDGSQKSVTGTGTHGESYDYGVETVDGVPCLWTKVTKLGDDNTTATGEWVKSYTDGQGRSVRTTYADGTQDRSYYSALGQLYKTIDRTGAITLYQYNSAGDLEYTVLDMDRDGQIDWTGPDRITRTVSSVVSAHGTAVRRSETYVWDTDSSSASRLVGTSDQSLDGLNTWQMMGTVTNSAAVTYPGSGVRRVTQTRSDGSQVVQETQYGRPTLVKQIGTNGVQLGAVSFGYDAHGRRSTVTDARNGTTTTYYNAGDLVTTNVTATPSSGRSAQTTIYQYDSMGRVYRTILPDKTEVEQEYFATGELKTSSGSRTYPVEYGYDYAGRVKRLKTWREAEATNTVALTQWFYVTNSGALLKKRYDNGKEVSYEYGTNTLLSKRTWSRGLYVNYSYDNAGALTLMDYSDVGTPDVTVEYDRLGRKKQVKQGPTGAQDVTSFYYTDFGGLAGTKYVSGPLAGISVTNRYDEHLRRNQLGVALNGSSIYTVGYGYDVGSRLGWVTNGNSLISYEYHTNSPLVYRTTFKQSGTTRLTTTKQYDALNRLTYIGNEAGAGGTELCAYDYNDANQRSVVKLADGSYWEYRYDKLGQVVSGRKFFKDGSPMPGQQFGYDFDDIGNRVSTERDGETANYVVNGVNAYQQRTVPGVLPIVGKATPTAGISVNGADANRKGDYFWKFVSVDNSSQAQWQTLSITATVPGGSSNTTATGGQVLPPHTEAYVHDADGNLTEDGLWSYTWDGENRLIGMQAKDWGNATVRIQMLFGYDWMGRRIKKTVKNYGVVTEEKRYVYDGWNLVAELNGSLTPVKTFTWGKDLSGSLQGAGGVGGLLAMTTTTNSTTQYVGYDGNGNVSVLVNATNGLWSGQYEYGPFGESIRVSGTAAKENPFRFSTKYEDTESGHLYYGYRYYNPSTGRWLSRDPMEEKEGINLAAFCYNNSISKIDSDGRKIPAGPVGVFLAIFGAEMRLFDMRMDQINGGGNPTSESFWASGKHISLHLLRFCFCPRDGDSGKFMDGVYDRLKKFLDFDTKNNYQVFISNENSGMQAEFVPNHDYEEFGLQMSGHLDARVDFSYDNKDRVVTATTAGSHFLHGVRKWGIKMDGDINGCCGRFTLWTQGVEQFNSLRFRAGNSVFESVDYLSGSTKLGFHAIQEELWSVYLNNVVDALGLTSCRSPVKFYYQSM